MGFFTLIRKLEKSIDNWNSLNYSKRKVIKYNLFNLLDKYFWIFIFSIVGYLIFHKNLILFLEKTVYFENIHSSIGVYPLTYILIILLFLGITVTYVRYAWINRRENNYLIIAYLLLVIFYFDNRIIRPEFYPFNPICILETDIIFFDLIMFPILSFLIFYKLPIWLSDTFHIRFEDKKVKRERIEDDTKNNYFLEDNPTYLTNDSFIVDELLHIIENDYYQKSFSIGIIGEWGNGKSTLINAFIDKVEELDSSTFQLSYL